jgi:hypothetical protein
MDLQEIGWENVHWILLVQNSNQRCSLENMGMNLWVKEMNIWVTKCGKFLD